jgi:hypothetical protein
MADPISNVDLGLIQTLLQKASRDAEAALAATERLYSSVLPRLSALESRFSAMEARFAGMEGALDHIGRSNHRLETMLADIAGRI